MSDVGRSAHFFNKEVRTRERVGLSGGSWVRTSLEQRNHVKVARSDSDRGSMTPGLFASGRRCAWRRPGLFRARTAGAERAAALVEFALILPILVMFLAGIVSSGILYNKKLSMSYAAREGARYGSLHDVGDNAWATNVASFFQQRSNGDVKSSDICVALVEGSGASTQLYRNQSTYGSSGAACASDDGSVSGTLRVQVVVIGHGQFDAVFFTIPVTLKANATARYEE